MRYVLGSLVLLFALSLAVSMIRGRAQIRACCPSDPSRDLRLRTDDPQT